MLALTSSFRFTSRNAFTIAVWAVVIPVGTYMTVKENQVFAVLDRKKISDQEKGIGTKKYM